ncbi:MAG: hypothetical protein ACE5GL_11375 [Calditrichia bacterium]
MNLFKYRSRIFLISMVLLSMLLAIGCSDNETTAPQGEAPELPPQSTMVMDFAAFPDTTAPSPFLKNKFDKTLSYENWGWSAFNIVVWNTVLTFTLALPVAAFEESFNHEPEFIDGSWVWKYNFNFAGVQHTAELHGTNVSNGVEWKMIISKNNGFQNFEWFNGFSNTPLTEGNWTLNKDPDEPTPFLGIEWHRNPAQNTADIKYTNIIPDDPENGGFIFYGITSNNDYDRFYDIFNKGQNNHTNIEWLFATKEGRVKDPRHFGDSQWHCWDVSLQDVTCP